MTPLLCNQSPITLKHFRYSSIFHYNHREFYQQTESKTSVHSLFSSYVSLKFSHSFTLSYSSLTTCLNVSSPVWSHNKSLWSHTRTDPHSASNVFPCLTMKSNRAPMERAQVTAALFHPSISRCHLDMLAAVSDSTRRSMQRTRIHFSCLSSKSTRSADKIINKARFLALRKLKQIPTQATGWLSWGWGG